MLFVQTHYPYVEFLVIAQTHDLSAISLVDIGGIQHGASPHHHHHRRAAEQMRRRRDRILQRKEAAAAAAAAIDDGDSAQKRRAAEEASAIVDAALKAGETDGDAILRMIDGRMVTEGEQTPAVTKGATEEYDLGAVESHGMVSW